MRYTPEEIKEMPTSKIYFFCGRRIARLQMGVNARDMDELVDLENLVYELGTRAEKYEKQIGKIEK